MFLKSKAMQEIELVEVIDKLVKAGVTLAELEAIKPLIGSEDFKQVFDNLEHLPTVLKTINS